MHFPYKQLFCYNSLSGHGKLFYKGLDLCLPMCTLLGLYTGLNAYMRICETNQLTVFSLYCNMITYSGIGIITGLLYPISFPLIGVYTLYNNYYKLNH